MFIWQGQIRLRKEAMRCSECLGVMKPYKHGFKCQSCGSISTTKVRESDSNLDLDHLPQQSPLHLLGRILLWLVASLVLMTLAGLAAWQYGPKSLRSLAVNPARSDTSVPQTDSPDIAVETLAVSPLFSEPLPDLEHLQSLHIPSGITPIFLGRIGGKDPAFALVGSARDEDIVPARVRASLLIIGETGRSHALKPLYLPPASRLQSASLLPDGDLLVLSEQALQYTLQKLRPDGQTIWSTTLDNAEVNSSGIVMEPAASGTFLLYRPVGAEGLEVAFVDADGQAAWSRRLSQENAKHVLATRSPFEEVVVAYQSGRWLSLVGLSQDGQERWSENVPMSEGETLQSISTDILGNVSVLTGPSRMRLRRFNSLGAGSGTIVLPIEPGSYALACTLAEGTQDTVVTCNAPGTLEQLAFSPNGALTEHKTLPIAARLIEAHPLAEQGLQIFLSDSRTDSAITLDIFRSPSPQTATSDNASPPVEELSPSAQSASPGFSPAPAPADPPPEASIPVEETPLPATDAPAEATPQSELSCRFMCAVGNSPGARFPIDTTLLLESGLDAPARETRIDEEWTRACESHGGIRSETVPPECTP